MTDVPPKVVESGRMEPLAVAAARFVPKTDANEPGEISVEKLAALVTPLTVAVGGGGAAWLNRSLRSVWLAASPRNGTPKISSNVRRAEPCV